MKATMWAVARPIVPPRGGMIDFRLTDMGMMIIFNPDAMDHRQAIDLAALLSGTSLVDAEAEVSA